MYGEHVFLQSCHNPNLGPLMKMCGWGPVPAWLSSIPMGPAWISPSLTRAEVMASVPSTPTSLGQPCLIHFRSSGLSTDLALKRYLINKYVVNE